jgi:hypothetical protein
VKNAALIFRHASAESGLALSGIRSRDQIIHARPRPPKHPNCCEFKHRFSFPTQPNNTRPASKFTQTQSARERVPASKLNVQLRGPERASKRTLGPVTSSRVVRTVATPRMQERRAAVAPQSQQPRGVAAGPGPASWPNSPGRLAAFASPAAVAREFV